MNNATDLRSIARGVGQFICAPNCLNLLDEKLRPFACPAIITGKKAYTAFLQFSNLKQEYPVFFYDGSCTHENIAELVATLPEQCDCIVAIGGGKLIDTAKSVANQLNVEYITVPTVLGTCAAYTPLSIIYHPNHQIKCGEHYERAAYLCLADLNLLVHSPKRYLLAGIGDTLAKWYEADSAVQHLPEAPSALVLAAHQMAKIIRDVLLAHSQSAVENLGVFTVSESFKLVVESILCLGGMVGGLAGRQARVAGAHAIHDGMSSIAETCKFDHGIKVAYGILVQLAAEKKFDEIQHLLPYFEQNGFIRTLSGFGVKENLEEKMAKIAEVAALEKQTFRLAVPHCTPQQIVEAMQYLEHLGK